MKDDIINSFTFKFRLFKQPKKIGDTFEHRSTTYLIIGIENFELLYESVLEVSYICQNIQRNDFKRKVYKPSYQLEFVMRRKYDDSKRIKELMLGNIFEFKGENYKIMEYTKINLEHVDISISFLARPVYPINPKEAKSKYINERKKKLQLEVF
ncbi:hypothetical protein VQL36_14605 [Chengkuizengella sp. SCS-71B]|uniref:hypothetical protein n=1 Tax=Chengkuizengella sp. SCS-71B TaxID=3115290 RepID=UPI0032C2223F